MGKRGKNILGDVFVPADLHCIFAYQIFFQNYGIHREEVLIFLLNSHKLAVSCENNREIAGNICILFRSAVDIFHRWNWCEG